MNLNTKALLVQLSISQWSARKHDKKVTKDVANTHNVTSSVGRYNKALLPMNDLLDRVHKKSGWIRTKYYQNTLPWGIDGTMLLPTSNYIQFMNDFGKEKAEWQQLVDNFLNNYTSMVQDAARLLGPLYDPQDYPTLDSMRDKFKIDLAVFPVPTSDFRVEVNDAAMDAIRQDVERRVKESEAAAIKDVWQRLFERVKNIADKLEDPNAQFRDSLVDNVREICDLLPRLNFADDPQLNDMCDRVRSSLIKNPDALRHNPAVRQSTAEQARDIVNKMSIFLGGA
jgi:hypothetical protein